MQVQFNKPVTIGGVTYGKGVHAIDSDSVKDDWFFDSLVKDGDAFVLQGEDEEKKADEDKPKKLARKSEE